MIVKPQIQCQNDECNHEFEVDRVLSKPNDKTIYGKGLIPMNCPKCKGTELTRIKEETEGLPALGKWSAMNSHNQLDKSMKAAQRRNDVINKSIIEENKSNKKQER